MDEIAAALLTIGAVGFSPNAPITFKSGIRSPVYVDNRVIPYWPAHWRTVISGFQQVAETLEFDVIAGIEAAGIPHSAALAYALGRPSVFIRKQAKTHGTRNRIEGGDVKDQRVLLIEDLVTTGGSSLSGVDALREAGATCDHCLAIVSYGFPEAKVAFDDANITLHTLTTFDEIITQAGEQDLFTRSDLIVIQDWLRDPHGWATRQGHD